MGPSAHSRITTRRLLKMSDYTLTVVLTLAVGIGTATAVFSLAEGILLRPLLFADLARLVQTGDHLGGHDGMVLTAREIETYPATTTALHRSVDLPAKILKLRAMRAPTPKLYLQCACLLRFSLRSA